jgi:protein TonB
VLSRARAALQAGRLEAPEGRNALDLFQAVLLAQPDQAEAQASLARTVDLLLERARQESDAGQTAEAERLVQRVLAVVPGHEAAQTLARRLNPGDTPSRQLSSEQKAEVEAQLAANAGDDGDASVAVPTPAPAQTLAEIEAALAALPGPVTRIGAPAAKPAPDAPSAAVSPVVRPDPLAPRVVNPRSSIKPVRSYAREPANVLPTVGMTGPTARRHAEPPAGNVTTMASEVVAADALERIATRDPVYPAQALRNGTKGWVELAFTVTANGSVRDIEIVAAEPRGVFDSAASDAVAAWRFRPRVVNGQPVAQRSTVTMRFDVDS